MPDGFTLLEALLAAVVLALVVGAILVPFTAAMQSTAQDARQTLAANLAQELMEEILSKSYDDPDGTERNEIDRQHWDDMRDYDGYSEPEGAIKTVDGSTFTDPASKGLSRTVKVESVYVAGQDTTKSPSFLRITVNVCYHGQILQRTSRLVYANKK